MELKRIDAFFLKALFLVVAGIIITQVLERDSVSSILFLLTFPLTIVLWIRSIRQTFSATDMIVVIACVLAILSVLLNASKVSAAMDFEYLKKLIMFVMTLLFFQTAYRLRIHEGMRHFIRHVVDLLVLFLILMYFLQTRRMHMLNGRQTIYLTFNFSNPNMTALFLTCLYMLKMHRLFEGGRWYVKLVNILQQILLAWFILTTQSRNCLLVMVIYTVLLIWLMFRSRKKLWVTKGWTVLFVTSPALLVAAYMLLVNSTWIKETFSFLAGEGKSLDSRVRVWSAALEELGKSPVIGAYNEISAGTGHSQMHNTHLDIAVSYGVPVLVLVCILLGKYLHQRGRVYQNKRSYIYILGFACAILMGMGEATVFSGGLGIYVFAGTFLLLSNWADPTTEGRRSV